MGLCDGSAVAGRLCTQRVELEVQRWALEGGTSGAELPSVSVSTISSLMDAAAVHKEAAQQFESNYTTGTKFW